MVKTQKKIYLHMMWLFGFWLHTFSYLLVFPSLVVIKGRFTINKITEKKSNEFSTLSKAKKVIQDKYLIYY